MNAPGVDAGKPGSHYAAAAAAGGGMDGDNGGWRAEATVTGLRVRVVDFMASRLAPINPWADVAAVRELAVDFEARHWVVPGLKSVQEYGILMAGTLDRLQADFAATSGGGGGEAGGNIGDGEREVGGGMGAVAGVDTGAAPVTASLRIALAAQVQVGAQTAPELEAAQKAQQEAEAVAQAQADTHRLQAEARLERELVAARKRQKQHHQQAHEAPPAPEEAAMGNDVQSEGLKAPAAAKKAAAAQRTRVARAARTVRGREGSVGRAIGKKGNGAVRATATAVAMAISAGGDGNGESAGVRVVSGGNIALPFSKTQVGKMEASILALQEAHKQLDHVAPRQLEHLQHAQQAQQAQLLLDVQRWMEVQLAQHSGDDLYLLEAKLMQYARHCMEKQISRHSNDTLRLLEAQREDRQARRLKEELLQLEFLSHLLRPSRQEQDAENLRQLHALMGPEWCRGGNSSR